jgi:hypothetical protein
LNQSVEETAAKKKKDYFFAFFLSACASPDVVAIRQA